MINPFEYDEAKNQAEMIKNKLQDFINESSNPKMAQGIIDSAQSIEDDLSSKVNPRSVEENVQKIIISIKDISNVDTDLIDPDRINWLEDQYENLRLSIRKFENY